MTAAGNTGPDGTSTEHDAQPNVEATTRNTHRAQRQALRYFWAWAKAALELEEHYPVNGDIVVRFLLDHLAGLEHDLEKRLVTTGIKKPGLHAVATIEARVRHLSKAHRIRGLPSPTDDPRVRETLREARRQRTQDGGQRQAIAVTLDILEQLLATCTSSERIDVRDRALLLFAWGPGGRRRSEITNARVEDLTRNGDEYTLNVRRSETEREGPSLVVPIAGRVAIALDEWLTAATITTGPIFRRVDRWGNVGERALSDTAVYQIIQRRAAKAGFDPTRFGAHSLRAGFLTTAGQRGISLQDAMALSGHRSPALAMRYHRAGDMPRSDVGRLAG